VLGRHRLEPLRQRFEGGDRLGGLGALLAGAGIGGGEFEVPGSEFGLERVDLGVAVLELGLKTWPSRAVRSAGSTALRLGGDRGVTGPSPGGRGSRATRTSARPSLPIWRRQPSRFARDRAAFEVTPSRSATSA
jgi:hypothetical protein